MTEIDMSENMNNSRKYANNCSYLQSGLPKSIIQQMFLVIATTKRV